MRQVIWAYFYESILKKCQKMLDRVCEERVRMSLYESFSNCISRCKRDTHTTIGRKRLFIRLTNHNNLLIGNTNKLNQRTSIMKEGRWTVLQRTNKHHKWETRHNGIIDLTSNTQLFKDLH